MARRPSNPASAPRSAQPNSVRALVLLFCTFAIGLLVIAAPALIVLVVGMVPTAVALSVDRDPQKLGAVSVAAMNFAGSSPYLVGMVFGDASLSHALELITNVFVLAVIYSAAAAGWLLVLALPPVTTIVLRIITDARIDALRKEQAQLVEDWSEAVSGG